VERQSAAWLVSGEKKNFFGRRMKDASRIFFVRQGNKNKNRLTFSAIKKKGYLLSITLYG
jgi:hypothetical protein